MSYRWLWWSILGAGLAMFLVYALALAINRLNPGRPSSRATLVWSQTNLAMVRHAY